MNCKEYYEEFLRQKNNTLLKDYKKDLDDNKNVLQVSNPKIVRNISDCRSFFDNYSKCKENQYKKNCYRLLETYNDCLKNTK